MPDNDVYVFLKLQKLRADKGLRKSELARLSNVAVNTLNAAEKRVGNKLETLMRIFNVLNSTGYYDGTLSPDELIIPKKLS
ncbi:MAG: helix-turn-helix transcriptional regulator [Pseudomonadota bacterium]